jgi:hypothetical protein
VTVAVVELVMAALAASVAVMVKVYDPAVGAGVPATLRW